MNNAIRAVVFDVGGVLIRTRDQSGRRQWEDRLGLAHGEAEELILNGEMGRRAQHGEITEAELWSWARDYLNLGTEFGAFQSDFWRGDFLDESLVRLIRRLRPKYQTAIISNAMDGLLNTLAHYQIDRDFDVVIGSAYVGVMKPNARIYEAALIALGRAPFEVVFIDDMPANVVGAERLGMHAIRFHPEMNLEGELAKLGVIADAGPGENGAPAL